MINIPNKKFKPYLNFDHGVQYIAPHSSEFKKFILKLYKKKVLKIWDGNHLDFTFKKKTNKFRYIGKKANNDICKYQLKKIKQNYLSAIYKIKRKDNFWEITLINKKKYVFKSLIIIFLTPNFFALLIIFFLSISCPTSAV